MSPDIFFAQSDEDIQACFPAFLALRPHLDGQDLLSRIRRQQEQGYQILAIRQNGEVCSVAGFRCAEFLAWGKILYIDDLSTLPQARRQGHASRLIDELIQLGKQLNCQALHLDSGYQRQLAHRLYLNKGFQLSSHHFSLALAAC